MESIFMFFTLSIFSLMTIVSFGILYSILTECKGNPSEIKWALGLLIATLVMGVYGLTFVGLLR